MPHSARPLWTCPKCGAKLLTKNLWHSCGRATLADWKNRRGPRAREFYDRVQLSPAAPFRSRRLAKVEEVVPEWWAHRLKITDVAQLDGEVRDWIKRSYRLMAMQGRLTSSAKR